MEDPLIGFISEPFRHLIEREKNSKARSGCHSLLFPDDNIMWGGGTFESTWKSKTKEVPSFFVSGTVGYFGQLSLQTDFRRL